MTLDVNIYILRLSLFLCVFTPYDKTILGKLKKYLQNKTQNKLNLAEAAEGEIIKKQKNEVPLPAVTHKDDSLLQLDESLPDPSQVPIVESPSVNPDSTQLDEFLPEPSQVPVIHLPSVSPDSTQLDQSLPDPSHVPVIHSPSVNPDSTQFDESLPNPSQVPIVE